MTTASRLHKVEAHASHLLDQFLRLRERYSFLEPMLFDQQVATAHGSGPRARGFNTLRDVLFLTCAQDIAKLCTDMGRDERTPSIRYVVHMLEDEAIRAALEERYATWELPSIETESDPEIVEALERIQDQERADQRLQFRERYDELCSRWSELSASDVMAAFRTIRDKVSAHSELRFVADKYEPVHISSLGLTWKDVRLTIDTMQRLVELIGLVVRNAGFAWDSFDENLSDAAAGFWKPT